MDFANEWARFHPTCPPVGWMMRNGGERHWLRFHSLPESKRYAETDAERDIAIARLNIIAAEVLGNGENCWLVQACWDVPEGMTEIQVDPFAARREYSLLPSFTFVEDPADEESTQWQAYAASTTWTRGAFDKLLRSIAEDQAAPTLWMSAATGAVFAPYDGGTDLFLSASSDVIRLRGVHPDWLSAHPQGL